MISGNGTTRFITALILAVMLLPAVSSGERVFFREDFNDLANWKPMYFPKVKKHTMYTIVTDAQGSYLEAESRGSASALVYKREFSVYDYPRIRWRWKVENVYHRADPHAKEGDDYPMRVYVAFAYDPAMAGFFERTKYEIARGIYGEYPPHSTLSYVWSSVPVKDSMIVSPYTSKAMIVVLQQGAELAGTWQEQEVDIVADYRKAFGTSPPASATLAVMNDSDNTGEGVRSYLDYVEVFSPK